VYRLDDRRLRLAGPVPSISKLPATLAQHGKGADVPMAPESPEWLLLAGAVPLYSPAKRRWTERRLGPTASYERFQ